MTSRPLPPSCPKHPGFIASACQPCAGFPHEASSVRGIAKYRQQQAKLDPLERAIAVFGRRPKR